LKVESVEEILDKRELWLNYWMHKLDIKSEYGNLKAFEGFSTQDFQDQFLLGMIYINIITSTVVDESDPAWKENQTNNSNIIKNAAKKFQQIMQEVVKNTIEERFSISKYGSRKNPHSWASIKKHKLKLTWLILRKWLSTEGRYVFVTDYLLHSKFDHIEFFDDVFCYSIVNLNKRISQYYRKY
jgi:hypothetical protein